MTTITSTVRASPGPNSQFDAQGWRHSAKPSGMSAHHMPANTDPARLRASAAISSSFIEARERETGIARQALELLDKDDLAIGDPTQREPLKSFVSRRGADFGRKVQQVQSEKSFLTMQEAIMTVLRQISAELPSPAAGQSTERPAPLPQQAREYQFLNSESLAVMEQ